MPENNPTQPAKAALQAQVEIETPEITPKQPLVPTGPLPAAREPLAQAIGDQAPEPKPRSTPANVPLAAASEPLAQPMVVPAAAPAPSPGKPAAGSGGVVVTTPVKPPGGGAAAPQTFLTGSAVAAEQAAAPRPRLPWGIYVVAGLNLAGFLFANTVATGTAGYVALAVQFLVLAVSIGLLFRYEPARQVAAVLATLSTVLAVLISVSMFGARVALDNNALTGRQRLQESLAHTNASAEQRRAMDNELASLDQQRAVTDRALVVAGLYNLASAAAYGVQAVYLRRPHVRAAFHKLQA